jgi:hypothetical protein
MWEKNQTLTRSNLPEIIDHLEYTYKLSFHRVDVILTHVLKGRLLEPQPSRCSRSIAPREDDEVAEEMDLGLGLRKTRAPPKCIRSKREARVRMDWSRVPTRRQNYLSIAGFMGLGL